MIYIFRKNDIANILFLLPYLVLLRLYSFLYPTAYDLQEHSGIVSEWIFNALAHQAMLQSIIALLLIYAQAILINIETNNNRLFLMQNSVPGLLYGLFASFFVAQQGLSPALIAMTFVLLATFDVFRVYKKNQATSNIFNAGIFLAIAAIIYPPCILLVIALFIEIGILRSFTIRERLQYISGLVAIYWIVGVFLFYFGWLNSNFLPALSFGGSISSFWPFSVARSWPLVLILFAVVVALANHYNYMKKKGIESRKKIDFFYWAMLFSFVPILIFAKIDLTHMIYLAMPLAILTSMNLTSQKSVNKAELIHIGLLLAVFLSLYSDKLNIF